MNFQDAASRQYRRTSYYTVNLVKPDATIQMGYTQGKSGAGLIWFIRGERAQAILMAHLGEGSEVEITKKTATALHLSNGWRVEFGGTIRQEAS